MLMSAWSVVGPSDACRPFVKTGIRENPPFQPSVFLPVKASYLKALSAIVAGE